VVFDAYGTLFDWASAAERTRDVLGDRWREFADLWRAKQLQYTWLRSLMGRHADFWQVTSESLDFALDAFGIADGSLRPRLMGAYLHVAAYPDARPCLERLRAAGLATAILSNGEPRMLEAAVESGGLGALLDAVLSVETARVYKPHPSVYQLATERFGAEPGQLLFVSANGWDAWGASTFGMQVAWCNRTAQRAERLPDPPGSVVRSLAEIPALLGIG